MIKVTMKILLLAATCVFCTFDASAVNGKHLKEAGEIVQEVISRPGMFHSACPYCGGRGRIVVGYFGERVRCKNCNGSGKVLNGFAKLLLVVAGILGLSGLFGKAKQ